MPAADEHAVALAAVEALATIPDRGAATPGELAAAQWAADELREGLRFWIPTDGVVPMRAGYRERAELLDAAVRRMAVGP